MAIITNFFGGSGLVAGALRSTVRAAAPEWLGGLLLVTSLVALGYNLAQAA